MVRCDIESVLKDLDGEIKRSESYEDDRKTYGLRKARQIIMSHVRLA